MHKGCSLFLSQFDKVRWICHANTLSSTRSLSITIQHTPSCKIPFLFMHHRTTVWYLWGIMICCFFVWIDFKVCVYTRSDCPCWNWCLVFSVEQNTFKLSTETLSKNILVVLGSSHLIFMGGAEELAKKKFASDIL